MGDKMELSEAQLDVLKEVGNIGAAHASAALEQMVSERVTISVPRIYTLPVEDLLKAFGREEDIIVMLFLRVFGEVEGSIIVTFTEEQAMSLANLLLGGGDTKWEMTEEKESALKETGNILASSYLTALSTFVGFNLMPSIPYIAYDMVGAVIDPLIIDLSKTVDYALVTDAELVFPGRGAIVGKCITFFSRDSFTAILEALGMHDK